MHFSITSRLYIMKKLLFLLCLMCSFSLAMGCCVSLVSSRPADNEFVDHLNQSTVALVEKISSDEYLTYCSGFWISDYYIATAYHCVELEKGSAINSIITYTTHKEFSINIPEDMPKNVYSAIVVAVNEETDLAVLKTVDDVEHHTYRLNKDPIAIGTEVHMMGHTMGLQYAYIKGTVSQIRYLDIPEFKVAKIIQISSLIHKGNSGCAAVDNNGYVVGIASFIKPNVPGLSFFIHKDELVKLLEKNDIKYYN